MFGKILFLFDVIIIGGGLSGLSTLQYLAQHNITNVALLEANSYLGGRMIASAFHDVPSSLRPSFHTINLGPKWIENTKNNAFYSCCIQHYVAGNVSNNNNVILVQNGNYQSIENEWNRLQTIYQKMTLDAKKDNSYSVSIRDALSGYGWDNETSLKNAIEYYLFDFEYGEEPEYTSLRALQNNVADADYFFITDPLGMNKGLQRFMTSFDADKYVHLSQEVISITYDEVAVYYSVKSINHHSNKEEKRYAKHIVYTGSLGTLKHESSTMFHPPLPESIQHVIKQEHYVDYLTIFLRFDDIFWNSTYEYFLYPDPERTFVVFMNLGHEKYYREPILMTVVTSTKANEMELLSDDEIKTKIQTIINEMFSTNRQIQNILVSRWNENPRFRGSFSDWSIGLSDQDMKSWLYDIHGLHFGGEHTSIEENGYLQGAYLSGQRIGESIVSAIPIISINNNTFPLF